MKRVLLLMAALAVAAAAANGGSSLAAGAKTIKVADSKFGPKRVTVAKGTRVTWRWVGRLPHNVTVRSGPKRFRSGTKSRGTFSVTLRKAGTYRIVCTLHRSIGMVETIVVR